ncbi:unnamed protein product [Protopolystoma xenopodis]|uniref:Uncharacterized protein n=1 Tax=Protopolystoma xenopodis TaxID=117903 RepID=A0A448XKM0_9PLAT|nr:unnamed protein product [Protopolystoma xenopodis]
MFGLDSSHPQPTIRIFKSSLGHIFSTSICSLIGLNSCPPRLCHSFSFLLDYHRSKPVGHSSPSPLDNSLVTGCSSSAAVTDPDSIHSTAFSGAPEPVTFTAALSPSVGGNDSASNNNPNSDSSVGRATAGPSEGLEYRTWDRDPAPSISAGGRRRRHKKRSWVGGTKDSTSQSHRIDDAK